MLVGEFQNNEVNGYAVEFISHFKITKAMYYEDKMHGLKKVQYSDKANYTEYWLAESGHGDVRLRQE